MVMCCVSVRCSYAVCVCLTRGVSPFVIVCDTNSWEFTSTVRQMFQTDVQMSDQMLHKFFQLPRQACTI